MHAGRLAICATANRSAIPSHTCSPGRADRFHAVGQRPVGTCAGGPLVSIFHENVWKYVGFDCCADESDPHLFRAASADSLLNESG